MSSVYLSSVKIQDFRSLKAAEVELPRNGFLLVEGKNHDTGGSSGAGKSSFFYALQTAFDCCAFPGTETEAWDAEKGSRVEVRFTSDEVPYTVVRGGRSSIRTGD